MDPLEGERVPVRAELVVLPQPVKEMVTVLVEAQLVQVLLPAAVVVLPLLGGLQKIAKEEERAHLLEETSSAQALVTATVTVTQRAEDYSLPEGESQL